MDPFARIDTHIATVRRARLAKARVEALWTASLALVSGALLGVSWAAALGSEGGWAGWIAIALGLVGALGAAWWLWWRPRQDLGSESVARWIEQRASGLHSGVITSVQVRDLGSRLADSPWPPFSPHLARAAAEVTARALDHMDLPALVDLRRSRGLGRLGRISIALAALAVWWGFEPLLEGARHLAAPRAEAAVSGGDPLVDVAVGDLSFRLIYPAYLDLPPREIVNARGDISAPRGTEILFHGRVLHPAQGVLLERESDEGPPPSVALAEDGSLSGSIRVTTSDRYRFALVTPEGGRLVERSWRTLDARVDQPPDVRMLLPETDLEVNPSDDVGLLFEAMDDHGLDSVTLVVDRGDGRPPTREVVRRGQGERSLRGNDALAIAPLALAPGDSVEIWFEAHDRNSVDGPGVGRSATRRVWMYSPEAEHERRLVELEQLIDVLIDVLADRLESPISEGELQTLTESVTRQQEISSSMASVLGGFEALLGAMHDDSLASDAFRNTLQGAFDRLQDHQAQEAAHLRQAVIGSGLLRRPAVLAVVLREVNDEGIGEGEGAIFDLKDLLDQSRQERVLEQGRALLDAQAGLMDLLEQLRDGSDAAMAQDAQRLLDQLETNLRHMEREMARLAERSPYENQNPTQQPSDTEEDMASLRQQMDEIRALIAEGKYDEAMARLDALSKATQELMAALKSDFGPGSPTMSRAREAMTRLHMKLSEVTDAQQGVHDETLGMGERLDGERRRALQERHKELLDRARQAAGRVVRTLEEADPRPLATADQEALQDLRDRASRLQQAVERLELEAAHGQAQKLGGQCQALGTEVGQSEARELDPDRVKGMKAAMERLGDAEADTHELARLLAELLEARRRPPSAEARRGIERLRKRQRSVRRELDRLGSSLGEMAEDLPGFAEAMGPSLEGSSGAMKDAQDALGEGTPHGAGKHQRRALERLAEARAQLERRMQQADGSSGGDGVGSHGNRRRVDIPDGDAYRAPAAFRQELLDAMKEKAPERYQRAIERYYQELVK